MFWYFWGLSAAICLSLPFVKRRADYEEAHDLGNGWEYHSLEDFRVNLLVTRCK